MASAQSPIAGISLRSIESNGISMRIAEAGDDGPVVLFAHGWPESWYSWRHQLIALAEAGYRAVAPDMRGYGGSDAPPDVEDYDMDHLTRDMVGILDSLGVETATIVGHDWGAPVAQYAALFYPERFTALAMLSVPYSGRAAGNPLAAMRQQAGETFFYIVNHNEPDGVAESGYDSDPRGILSRLYLSPSSPREAPEVTDPRRIAGGWIRRLGAPKGLPAWLTEVDLDYYVAEFERAGFRGGVNYYRTFVRTWAATAGRSDFTIKVPSMFLAGEKDGIIRGAAREALSDMMAPLLADLRAVTLVPEVGHWVQQEAPDETNAALLAFLEALSD